MEIIAVILSTTCVFSATYSFFAIEQICSFTIENSSTVLNSELQKLLQTLSNFNNSFTFFLQININFFSQKVFN